MVIEVKKTTNSSPDAADLEKLRLIKDQLRYRYALFLRLPAGPDADKRNVREVWV